MRSRMLLACVLVGLVCQVASAQPTLQQLQNENQQLRAQNQQMQQDLQQVLQRLDRMEQTVQENSGRAEYHEQVRAMLQELDEAQPSGVDWVTTMRENIRLKIYGFLRTDVAYDSRRTNEGYYAMFVLPESGSGRDDKTSFTARNTRIGMDFTFPEYEGWNTTGVFEIDFGTAGEIGTADCSAKLRLRRAAFRLSHEDVGTFVIGQEWDIFGRQNPRTVNVGILWLAGNVGYRRAQIRYERDWGLEDYGTLRTQVGVARAIGNNECGDPNITDGIDDGLAAGVDVQARVAWIGQLLTEKNTEIGFSGVWGNREVDAIGLQDRRYNACGVSFDLFVPLYEGLAFTGEWYSGKGLGGYLGNIGQYYNPDTNEAYQGYGGFVQLAYAINPTMTVAGGWAMDCVHDGLTAGDRKRNSVTYANFEWQITPNLSWAIEYQYMYTQYHGMADDFVQNNRVGTAFTLRF